MPVSDQQRFDLLLVDPYFRNAISHLICFGSNIMRDTLKSKLILDLVVFSLKSKGMIWHNPKSPRGWLDQHGDRQNTVSIQDTEAFAKVAAIGCMPNTTEESMIEK